MGGRQGGQWLEGRSRVLAKQASHIVEIQQAVQCWYISYTSKKCLDKTKKSQSGCCLECIQREKEISLEAVAIVQPEGGGLDQAEGCANRRSSQNQGIL